MASRRCPEKIHHSKLRSSLSGSSPSTRKYIALVTCSLKSDARSQIAVIHIGSLRWCLTSSCDYRYKDGLQLQRLERRIKNVLRSSDRRLADIDRFLSATNSPYAQISSLPLSIQLYKTAKKNYAQYTKLNIPQDFYYSLLTFVRSPILSEDII